MNVDAGHRKVVVVVYRLRRRRCRFIFLVTNSIEFVAYIHRLQIYMYPPFNSTHPFNSSWLSKWCSVMRARASGWVGRGESVCVCGWGGGGCGGGRVSVCCCSVPQLNAIGSKHTKGSKERLFITNT